MLWEWLQYLTSHAPKHVREIGYVSEHIGIESRHKRCEVAWEPHLQRSKSAILRVAESCERHRTVLILGSGLLLDVPIAKLSAQFQTVILCDIHHPKSVRSLIKKFPNVRLLECDLTGLSALLPSFTQRFREKKAEISALEPTWRDFPLLPETDLVVSLNLCSQLPVMPREYLMKQFPEIPDEDMRVLSQKIIRSHLEFLRSFTGKICLICDRERIVYRADNSIADRESAVSDVELPVPSEEWFWEIAPLGELDSAYGIRHIVGVHSIEHEARSEV